MGVKGGFQQQLVEQELLTEQTNTMGVSARRKRQSRAMRSLVVLSVCLVRLVEPRIWAKRAADRASALKWETTLRHEIFH